MPFALFGHGTLGTGNSLPSGFLRDFEKPDNYLLFVLRVPTTFCETSAAD